MANEMLTGLLNQTSGGNWWQGQAAPTSGYGSFTAPPQPAPTATPDPAAPPSDPGAPADPGGAPAQQTQQTGLEWKQKGMQQNQQNMSNMYAQQLAQLQKFQASHQPGSPQWNKYAQQIQQAVAQLRASQGGF